MINCFRAAFKGSRSIVFGVVKTDAMVLLETVDSQTEFFRTHHGGVRQIVVLIKYVSLNVRKINYTTPDTGLGTCVYIYIYEYIEEVSAMILTVKINKDLDYEVEDVMRDRNINI